MAQIIDLPTTNPVQGQNANPADALAQVPLPALASMMRGAARSTNAAPGAGQWQPGQPMPPSPVTPPVVDPNALNVVGYAPGTQPSPAGPGGTGPWGIANAQENFAGQVRGVAPPPALGAQLQHFLGGDAATAGVYDRQQALANFYSDPRVLAHMSANPTSLASAQADPTGFMMTLKPALDAASQPAPTHVALPNPDGTMTYKPITDPSGHQMTRAIVGPGASDVAIHAMNEAHHYSRDEFIAALRNTPSAMVDKLWSMQHYLTPDQQLLPQYVHALGQGIETNKQALATATQAGNKSEIAKAQKVLDASQAELNSLMQKKLEGMMYPYSLPPN